REELVSKTLLPSPIHSFIQSIGLLLKNTTATASAVTTFRQREEKTLPGSLHAPSRKPPGFRRGRGGGPPPPLRSRHNRSENPRRRFRPGLARHHPSSRRVPDCLAGVKCALLRHLVSNASTSASFARPTCGPLPASRM